MAQGHGPKTRMSRERDIEAELSRARYAKGKPDQEKVDEHGVIRKRGIKEKEASRQRSGVRKSS